MKKLAIFVEGQTEQIFAEALVLEVAGAKNVIVEKRKAVGGATARRRIRLIEAVGVPTDQRYFVLIVDCGSDGSVRSDIGEQYDSLVRQGYQRIIGIRDVYPFAHSEIPKLERGFRYKLKTSPITVDLVFAVMEIEAWFLSEYTHFERFHVGLTPERIRLALGFDPSLDDMESRPHPAADLHDVYALVGRAYKKTRSHVQRTVDLLDYANLYCNLAGKISSLGFLVSHLDAFLSS